MFAFAMLMSLCVDVMVMSSAYVVSFIGTCGVGVSDVYMLKSVGDRTPPCGTPFLNWRCVFCLFLNVVYALRPLMLFAMYLIMVCGMFVWWLQTTQPTSGGAVTADSSCCANCVEPPRPQQWGSDLPFFGYAGHADPLDGWRCCSQKRVMSRPIQVRKL